MFLGIHSCFQWHEKCQETRKLQSETKWHLLTDHGPCSIAIVDRP